jgi:hypothetical protein
MKGKRDRPIDLTDIGQKNRTRVRRLPYGEREPGYVDEDGWVTQEDGISRRPAPWIGLPPSPTNHNKPGLMRSADEPAASTTANDTNPIVFATAENSNKEVHNINPISEYPDYDLRALHILEANSSDIIDSTAILSTGKVSVRSQTPQERYDELEREQYDY